MAKGAICQSLVDSNMSLPSAEPPGWPSAPPPLRARTAEMAARTRRVGVLVLLLVTGLTVIALGLAQQLAQWQVWLLLAVVAVIARLPLAGTSRCRRRAPATSRW